MHHAGTQHAHHLHQQGAVVFAGILRAESHVVQAWRSVAVGVSDQLHQQHAIAKVIGLGHPHPGSGQAVKRVNLGALPGSFLRLAAKLGALGHGTGLAGIFDLAVFGVVHRLAKTSFGGFLVDLGAARVVANAHHVHHGFLAAHELPHNRVDQAFFYQGLQSLGWFHAPILPGMLFRAAARLPAGEARLWRTRPARRNGRRCGPPSGYRAPRF